MIKYIAHLLLLLTLALPAWALDSVEAIDRAIVQLIEDGSALQHTLATKTQEELTAAELNQLAEKVQAYEKRVNQLALEAKLSTEVVNQPEYGKLLDDSVRLSQVAVELSQGIEQLAEKVEDDAAGEYRNTLQTMIHAMLRLSDDIGVMADRILFTEEQIGIMADRIGEMADRILETQRIQNENIARVHDTSNRTLARLELPPVDTRAQLEAMQQSREAMMEQREAQQQMQEMKAQQQETQEQMQQLRGF